MIKRFISEILLDLGDLEADYRAFYLKNDIEQTILSLSTAVISVWQCSESTLYYSAIGPECYGDWRRIGQHSS